MANTKISALPAWTPTDVAEIPFVEWGVTYKGLKSLLNGADGNWIASIVLLSTVWLIKTYRITYTDATTFDYFTTDGTDWAWDMSKVTYDPTTVEWDAFDMDNMAESATKKILTSTERTKLSWIADGAEVNTVTLAWSETLTNKTVNWVTLNSVWSATKSLKEDGTYMEDAGGWEKLNFSFPHAYTNFTPFVANISDVISYTPPAWKVAYLTVIDMHAAWTWTDINWINVWEFWYLSSWGRVSLVRPLILNDTDVIDITQAGQLWSIAWFLVDENVDIEPITTSWSYTVPAWKYYIITNMYWLSNGVAENMMTIWGVIYSWQRTYNVNLTDVSVDTDNLPILWPWDTFNNVNMNHSWWDYS